MHLPLLVQTVPGQQVQVPGAGHLGLPDTFVTKGGQVTSLLPLVLTARHQATGVAVGLR